MIRTATTDDIDKLIALKTKVGRGTYFDYGTPEQFDAWVENACTEEYFEKLLNNSTTILVAEYEDALLGMASVSFYDDFSYFGNLYVGLQERGIGSILTHHRLQTVNNHVSLLGPLATHDIIARCFYQNYRAYRHLLKHGFTPYDWKLHEQYECPVVLMKQTISNPHNILT